MNIKEFHENAAKTADAKPRKIAGMEEGQWARQGDVTIVRVSAQHPHGPAIRSRQLADGTARGARHIVEAGPKLYTGTKLPEGCSNTRTPLGPCIVAGKEFTVTHPTHAHYILPAGVYQCIIQMNGHTWQRTQD